MQTQCYVIDRIHILYVSKECMLSFCIYGFTCSVLHHIFFSQNFDAILVFSILTSWYPAVLAHWLKKKEIRLVFMFQLNWFLCVTGNAGNLKMNQTLNLLIWHFPKNLASHQHIFIEYTMLMTLNHCCFFWLDRIFIWSCFTGSVFDFLIYSQVNIHLINDFVHLVFLHDGDSVAFIFVGQFAFHHRLIYRKQNQNWE